MIKFEVKAKVERPSGEVQFRIKVWLQASEATFWECVSTIFFIAVIAFA